MAVRRQINRYRTEPYGDDFEDVLKRAKRFFKDGTFGIFEYRGIWSTYRPIWGDPKGSIYFTKIGRRWERSEKR